MIEEIEKQAEEYVRNKILEHNQALVLRPKAIKTYAEELKQAFQDGAKWGMEHAIEWHDLRKNPNDLPKEEKEVLVYMWDSYYIGTYSSEDVEWWFNEFSLDYERLDEVIAWCELPQFKDKE